VKNFISVSRFEFVSRFTFCKKQRRCGGGLNVPSYVLQGSVTGLLPGRRMTNQQRFTEVA
jgi:hypothetical protein